MDADSKETPNALLGEAISEMSGTGSDESMQFREQECDETPISKEASTSKQKISDQISSFSQFRLRETEYDSEFESDEDDPEIYFALFGTSYPKRRTFSQCDSPVYPLPECKIYDSEADSEEGKRCNDKEECLRKFLVESAAWSKAKRRVKSKATLRTVKSDGEVANMSYCMDTTKISLLLSFMKRPSSAPPNSDSEAKQKQKTRIHNLFHQNLKFRNKSRQCRVGSFIDSVGRMKPSSKSPETCDQIDIEKSESLSEKTDPDYLVPLKASIEYSEETKYFSATESFLSASGSVKKSDSEDSKTHISLKNKKTNVFSERESNETTLSSEHSKISSTEVNFEKPASSKGNTLTAKAGCSSWCLEGSNDGKSKSTERYVLTPETSSSSENSEVFRITVARKPQSPPEFTFSSESRHCLNNSRTCCSADDSKQKSPPQIISEPPRTDSAVIKVPSKMLKFSDKTPELLDPPGTSEDDAAASSSPRRPTDLNVRRRSAFYSFSPTSPTNLILRPYRSLPNFNGPPMKNYAPRSIDFDNATRGRVIRSLFMGNYYQDRYTPSSGISTIPNEITSILRRKLSSSREESQGSSEKQNSGSKSKPSCSKNKACKKLFTSPSAKETNVTQTLQDHSSSELIGDVSNLNLSDTSCLPEEAVASKDLTPKRKDTSPLMEGPSSHSAKKIRSSEFDPEKVYVKNTSCETEIEDEGLPFTNEPPKDLLKPPNLLAAEESTSPKRKVEHLEDCNQSTLPKDQSPESASKKTKIKPLTPVSEIDTKEETPEQDEEKKLRE